MHTATLFLFSFVAGAISTPANRASLRLRRDDAFLERSESLSQADAELPPLPLEFEEQEEIYMSIDDPRVGTIDEEGNVLVPVDEEGRILPGFEHLVRPFQDSDLNSDSTKNIDDRTPVTEEETAASSSNDDVESSYDENAIDTGAAALPTASDYFDSKEADAEADREQKAMKAAAARPNPTGFEDTLQKEDDAEMVNNEESETNKKIDQLVNEILELSRQKELAEYEAFVEESTVSQPTSTDVHSTAQHNVGKVDEELFDVESVDDQALIVPASQGDSEEEDTRPQIGQGVGEVAKVLPVDEETEDMTTTNLRKGDILEQGGSEKAKSRPGSAALSSTLVSLMITVVFCVSRS